VVADVWGLNPDRVRSPRPNAFVTLEVVILDEILSLGWSCERCPVF
jgi:hypothetical protein